MNGTGSFVLGLVAAVALYLLWKKNQPDMSLPSVGPSGTSSTSSVGGCTGCGGGCFTGPDGCGGSPSAAVSPDVQSAMNDLGIAGAVSPGAPPLGGAGASGASTSYYAGTGPTSDASFTFQTTDKSVSGSPTTPAAVTPIRSTEYVGTHEDLGFISRYTRSGVYYRN